MQTTLECVAPATSIEVTEGNSTLIVSDEHREHLYRAFCPSFLQEEQINDHLLEKKAEEENLKNEFEYLQQFEEFRPKKKPQQYIRVGKR